MIKSKGIPQDRIKVQSLRPKGRINRRELLKLFLPPYEVLPFVEPTTIPADRLLLPALTKGLRNKLGNSSLLSEGKIARCRECGNVIGSRAMIGKLQVILQAVGRSLASQLELCSTCKIKQPSLGRATLELTASQGRIMDSLEEG